MPRPLDGLGHVLDVPHAPSIDLVDPADFHDGDGVRVIVTVDAMHIMIRRYERESGCIIPIDHLLDALGILSQKAGN